MDLQHQHHIHVVVTSMTPMTSLNGYTTSSLHNVTSTCPPFLLYKLTHPSIHPSAHENNNTTRMRKTERARSSSKSSSSEKEALIYLLCVPLWLWLRPRGRQGLLSLVKALRGASERERKKQTRHAHAIDVYRVTDTKKRCTVVVEIQERQERERERGYCLCVCVVLCCVVLCSRREREREGGREGVVWGVCVKRGGKGVQRVWVGGEDGGGAWREKVGVQETQTVYSG